MGPSISGDWLLKGHFDFAHQDPRSTTTIGVRGDLCDALGLEPESLRIGAYPTGPSFRHTFWWREGDSDFAEAQFVAAISRDSPILSLGLSVEKGVTATSARRSTEVMDQSWDWGRLLRVLPDILLTDVPGISAATGSPVHLRIRRGVRWEEGRRWWRTRSFSRVGDQWFERHAGRVRIEPEAIADYARELDSQEESWVVLTFTQDFGPAEADGMTPQEAARVLLRFNSIRERIKNG